VSEVAATKLSAKAWILPAVLLAILAACGGDADAGREAAAASESWSAYKSAILEKDGAKAVDRLSNDTIAYYEEVRVLALEADKADLAGRSLVDRLNVVTMRVTFTSVELRGLDGAGLVSGAVDRGLIGDVATQNTELRSVRVAGNAAVGELVAGGQTGGRLDFRREDGVWKVHLLTLIRSVDAALVQTARQRGQPEDRFILEVVGAASGKTLTEDVWDPAKF
jgi:hypothetical protein